MGDDDGIVRLQAYVERWPAGTSMTTRGLQVRAGIADLATAEGAAAVLRARGLLEMEAVGATHLWRRRERSMAPTFGLVQAIHEGATDREAPAQLVIR
jgi:hypothetical protein